MTSPGALPPVGTLIRATAPLRVSFAGGGTDVPPFPELEGGLVLSASMDRHASAALRPRADGRINVASVDLGRAVSYGVGEACETDHGLELVTGTIRRFVPDDCSGFDLFLHTDAPPGSGLGSSSTLMVALVAVLGEYLGLELSASEIADRANTIERIDLGISGGYQDHYAAAFGGMNLLASQGEGVHVEPLRLPDRTPFDLQRSLLLCFLGSTRPSDRIIDDQTARLVGGEEATLAGLRAQKALVGDMVAALREGDLDGFGHLLGVAWEEKKRLSPRITTPHIDEVYDEARRHGALGGKVTGAGGGGHMLLYASGDAHHRVADAVERMGVTATSLSFGRSGVRAWGRADGVAA